MSNPIKTREDLVNCAIEHILEISKTFIKTIEKKRGGFVMLSDRDMYAIMAHMGDMRDLAEQSAERLVTRFEEYFRNGAPAQEAAQCNTEPPLSSRLETQVQIQKCLSEAMIRIVESATREITLAECGIRNAVKGIRNNT